jgi:Fe-S-cluster containining protein
MQLSDLPAAVDAASQRPEVLAAVAEVYAALEAETTRRRPKCFLSGKCCNFEEYGHRLYVTTIELAAFVHEHRAAAAPVVSWNGKGCPFQVGRLCGVHAHRPMGCRLFFCDETSTDWQREQYERFHADLKRSHDSLGVPYAYLDWQIAVRALGLAS